MTPKKKVFLTEPIIIKLKGKHHIQGEGASLFEIPRLNTSFQMT